MRRTRAALIHLALSAAIALTVFLVIYFAWFPDVLFQGAGGRELFLLIACVDVVIGPLITLVVFVPGKKGLKFDLAVIALLQIAALLYGVHTLFEARPVYIAFVRDRYELVRANDILPEAFAKESARAYASLPLTGPKLVGVRLPTDPDEQFRLAQSAMEGRDVQTFPEYYVPYDAVRAQVRTAAKPVAQLKEFNKEAPGDVDRLVASLGRKEEELRFVPMRAGKRDLTVIVDAANSNVLRLSMLRPWQY